MDRAFHFEALDGGRVRCLLCPHSCVIGPGGLGRCRTRRNAGGALEVLTHGRLEAAACDPVEKKPLNHYRPGTTTFSVASSGCNLACPFCQNHHLSQALRHPGRHDPAARRWTAREIVSAALECGCASVSFTYSEPVLSFELAREVADAAAPEGLEIVFVTNGQVNPGPARELAAFLAAANVDLKCFSEASYRDVLDGSLSATLATIEILRERGVWVEVTTLVIPGFNDGEDELGAAARFLAGLDRDLPWHVSRFHPDHLWLDRQATPIETLVRAREIGLAAGLRHVYAGNVPGHESESTRCPACGDVVIERRGFRSRPSGLAGGRCRACGERIAGRGLP